MNKTRLNKNTVILVDTEKVQCNKCGPLQKKVHGVEKITKQPHITIQTVFDHFGVGVDAVLYHYACCALFSFSKDIFGGGDS